LHLNGLIKIDSSIQSRIDLGKSQLSVGKIVSLDAPMFLPDNTSMGLWRPLDYLNEFGGGLMLLQPYQQRHIPVVFIHGMSGSALEFATAIQSLDANKFQPWVLQYPSGLPLDIVSDYLQVALDTLQTKYNFHEVVLVAHSAGGVMMRSFVMKHQQSRSRYSIAMALSINSPMNGMPSAATGVKMSPIVIPIWRDLATGSDYLKRVNEWRWPKDIPYHLFFSYLPDESSDGVVPIASQLSTSLQEEAVRIYGFQAQHAGLLTEPLFIERLNALLAQLPTATH
jgi:uncharacterized alpha/beta hydrolase family protein